MNTKRRQFIRTTLLSAAAIGSSWPMRARSFEGAPSEKINVGLIGVRGMGFGILGRHMATGIVNCVALCDVDSNLLETRAAEVQKRYNQKPVLYHDFRKLLENKEIDSVIIGTPDHWHCLIMVSACQAGKDVYVEKPMANSIGECNIMMRAAAKYNRVVQVGQQQRSGKMWQKVNQMIKAGSIGELRKVNVWGNFNYGVGQPKVPDQVPPEGVDFDFWLGPAPERTFNPGRFHGSWRMFFDYGGGLITDWGAHLIDMAFWAKDLSSPPETIMASGANLSFRNNYHETFDTMSVIWQAGNFFVTWENTAGTENGPWGKNYGLSFIGDNGTLVVNRTGYQVIPEGNGEKAPFRAKAEEVKAEGENHGDHVENFLHCVKTRETPACPPETGRVVAIAAHAANIAVRTGANLLRWDDKTGRFSNSEEANRLVLPDYRAPWVLPDI